MAREENYSKRTAGEQRVNIVGAGYNLAGAGLKKQSRADLYIVPLKLSDFIKNILICVPKMKEGLMGLEQHEDE